MKHFSLLVSIFATLYVFPGLSIAQNEGSNTLFTQEVAKTGCCKVRKSSKHPWVKTDMNFGQCEDANGGEGDRIYKSSGQYWWDRSC